MAASIHGRSGDDAGSKTARTRAPFRSVRTSFGTTIDQPGSCAAGEASCASASRLCAEERSMLMTGAVKPSAIPRRTISRRESCPVRLSATRRLSGLELESRFCTGCLLRKTTHRTRAFGEVAPVVSTHGAALEERTSNRWVAVDQGARCNGRILHFSCQIVKRFQLYQIYYSLTLSSR